MWQQPSEKKDLEFPDFQQYFANSQETIIKAVTALQGAKKSSYPQLLTQIRDLAKGSFSQKENPLAGLVYLDLVLLLKRQDREWENIYMAVARLHQQFTQNEFQSSHLGQLTPEGKKWFAKLMVAINTKFENALLGDESISSEREKVEFQTNLSQLQKTCSALGLTSPIPR